MSASLADGLVLSLVCTKYVIRSVVTTIRQIWVNPTKDAPVTFERRIAPSHYGGYPR